MNFEINEKTRVRLGDNEYMVSTVKHEHACETMIFRAKRGKVVDWSDLFTERHGGKSREQIVKRHTEIVSELEAGTLGLYNDA